MLNKRILLPVFLALLLGVTAILYLSIAGKNKPVNKVDSPVTSGDMQGLRVVNSDPNQLVFPNSQSQEQSGSNATSNGTQTKSSSPSSGSSNKTTYSSPPPTQTQPTAPVSCNEQLKISYTNQRNSAIAYENAKHNNWGYGGTTDSSYYADAKHAEDLRHEAELSKIESDYNTKLASVNCL